MNHPGIPWIGSSLRVRRQLARMSQERLAKLLEVGETTVRRWEQDGNPPPADAIPKLCKVFGCLPYDFARKPKII